jgi:hypothetical protein
MFKPTYVRATVSGDVPIRDVLTRESVEPGSSVVLLVREPGSEVPRCPRHPKRLNAVAPVAGEPCYCHGTVMDQLVADGVLTDVTEYYPTPEPAAREDERASESVTREPLPQDGPAPKVKR